MGSKALPTAREMMSALLDVLAEAAGPLSVREIEQAIVAKLAFSEDQINIPHDKSRTEFQYRLAWTRSYAKKAGLVSSPRRNVWVLARPVD